MLTKFDPLIFWLIGVGALMGLVVVNAKFDIDWMEIRRKKFSKKSPRNSGKRRRGC